MNIVEKVRQNSKDYRNANAPFRNFVEVMEQKGLRFPVKTSTGKVDF